MNATGTHQENSTRSYSWAVLSNSIGRVICPEINLLARFRNDSRYPPLLVHYTSLAFCAFHAFLLVECGVCKNHHWTPHQLSLQWLAVSIWSWGNDQSLQSGDDLENKQYLWFNFDKAWGEQRALWSYCLHSGWGFKGILKNI